jgi:hypothetical protein
MVIKSHFLQSLAISRILRAHNCIAIILLMFLSIGLVGAGLGAEIAVKGQGLEGSVVGLTTPYRSAFSALGPCLPNGTKSSRSDPVRIPPQVWGTVLSKA